MMESNIDPTDSLLQNISPHNATPWFFQHHELFATDGADRSLDLKKLINKLNYIHFTDGHIFFLLNHPDTGAQIMIKAYPQPCVKNELVSRLDPSETDASRNLKNYELKHLMIDDGLTAILAQVQLISLEEGILRTILPETGRVTMLRKIKRFLCDDVSCRIIQGDFHAPGHLVDFSSEGLGINFSGNKNIKEFDETKSALININRNGTQIYSGLCQCVRNGINSPGNKAVFVPLQRNKFSLFPKREIRNNRQHVGPSFSASFQHPFFKGYIERDIFDISSSGFSIKDKMEENVLLPGMFIPDISIVYAGIVKMKCSAQVVYQQVDQETKSIKYGLAIAEMSLESFTHLSQILGVSNDSHASISTEVEMDTLWEFFFDTGFIYGKKYGDLQIQRETFKETYRKLYKDNPDIARHFVYKKNGKILGHIAMVHAYEPSWLIHHFAARRSGSLTGIMVIRQLIQYISSYNRLPSAGMDHVMSYYQVKNKVVDKIFGSFSRHINDPKKSSMDAFSYMLFEQKCPVRELRDGWKLKECSINDLAKLKEFYEISSGGLLLSSLGLDIPSESIKMSFASAGFKRDYSTHFLSYEDKPMAFFIVDRTEIKLNLSDLINGIKIIVLEPDILSWAMLSLAVNNLSHNFAEQKIPLLIFPSHYLLRQNIVIEKEYTLWILQLRHASDEYLSFINDIVKLQVGSK